MSTDARRGSIAELSNMTLQRFDELIGMLVRLSNGSNVPDAVKAKAVIALNGLSTNVPNNAYRRTLAEMIDLVAADGTLSIKTP